MSVSRTSVEPNYVYKLTLLNSTRNMRVANVILVTIVNIQNVTSIKNTTRLTGTSAITNEHERVKCKCLIIVKDTNCNQIIILCTGGTNTGTALKEVYSKMFTPSSGDRPDAPNIEIVITDGRSNNHPDTVKVYYLHLNIELISIEDGRSNSIP